MGTKSVIAQRIQDEFIFLCITDTEFLKKVRAVLKPEHFSFQVTEDVIRVCYSYFDKYKEAPTNPPYDHFYDEMTRYLVKKDADEMDRYYTYLKKVEEMKLPNKEYIFDRVNDFIGARQAEEYAVEYVQLIESGAFNQANLISQKMVNLGLGGKDFINGGKQRLITRRLSEVEPEKIKWLWYNKIPIGMVSLLVGDPKVGKSMLTDYIAAQATTGEGWPDYPKKFTKGSVVMLAAEDNVPAVLVPRLKQFHADLKKIVIVEGIEVDNTDEKKEFSIRDIDVLEQTFVDNPDTRSVIIDPISRYLGNINMNNQSDVVSAISPLNGLVEKYGVAIIIIAHLNKNQGAQTAYRVQGSIGFVSTARVSWQLLKDKYNPDKIIFAPLMGNLCINPTTISFAIRDRMDEGTLYLDWNTEPIMETIDELMSDEGLEHRTLTKDAMEFLQDILVSYK